MAPAAPAPPAPKFDPREIAGLKLWLDADQASVMGRDPKSVPGLKLWLKADAITGLSDGDPVATWSDSSGNGNDATQATEANKPLYKTNIQNGLPVVRFDSTDFLRATFGSALSQPGAIFVVAKGDTGAERTLVDGSTAARWMLRTTAGGGRQLYQGNVVLSGGAADADWHVWAAMFLTGANDTLYVDGIQDITPANSGTSTLAGLTVGADKDGANTWNISDGGIAEVLVYNRELSQAERAGVEKYLADKYALSAGGAPYADNDAVQAWQDLSGNGNHATQATASKKPLFKTGVQAGRPVMRFDGTDDYLVVANESQFDIAEPTIFVVAAADTTSGRRVLSKTPGSTTGYEIDANGSASGIWEFLCISGATHYAARKATLTAGQFTMLAAQFDSTQSNYNKSRLWAQGVEQTDFAATAGTVTTIAQNDLSMTVGANPPTTTFFDGDVAEVLVYDNALSDQKRKTIERYLATKWGIAYSG